MLWQTIGFMNPQMLSPNGHGDVHPFFSRSAEFEKYQQPQWWITDLLPEPLRHDSGHEGSHTFLTHEFIDALVNNRRPAVNVYEAVAYTAPGIVAHQSALKGREQMKVPQFDLL